MSDRNDVDLGFAQVTKKKMPNGEVRIRMGLPSGLKTTITEMPQWDWKERIPWQEGHYHQGLTEHYLVLNGWMVYVDQVLPRGEYVPRLVEVGHLITFCPGVQHLILLGPGAVIQTTLQGVSVGDPTRKGQDWWECEKYFKPVIRTFDCISFATTLQMSKERM